MLRLTARDRVLTTFCLLGLGGLSCHDLTDDLTQEASPQCLDRPVRMAVASSLRALSQPLIQQLLESDPPIVVEPIFGASSTHARQLSLGAPMDVLVSADAAIVDDLIVQGLLVRNSAFDFATGQLSVVAASNWSTNDLAQADRPTKRNHADAIITSVFEARHLSLVAIPSPAVPLGRYARAWLTSRGLLDQLHGKIVETEHARATLSAVDAGLADLAIVYRSDLRLAKSATPLAHIDPSEHPAIRYLAARTTHAPSCPSIDLALAAWGGARLQNELARAGFTPAFSMKDL